MNGHLARGIGWILAAGMLVVLVGCPKPPARTEFMAEQNVQATTTQLRLEVHAFADRCQQISVAEPVEQPGVEVGFERIQTPEDRRVIEAEAAGRTGQGTLFGNGQQKAEIVPVQVLQYCK